MKIEKAIEIIETSDQKTPSFLDNFRKIKSEEEYIRKILELQASTEGAKFWQEHSKDTVILNVQKQPTLENLIALANLGDAYSLLKQKGGYDTYFLPEFLKNEELYVSCSSGTTGVPKCVKHDKLALAITAYSQYEILKKNFDIDKLKGKMFICAGPFGGYQTECKYLSNLLGMQLESVPFDTTGIKLKSPEELQQIFTGVISKLGELLETGDVGFLTGAPIGNPTAGLPLDIWHKNDFIFRLSGAGLDYERAKLYERTTGGKAFPMFGHFAGKSSPGEIIESEKIVVYYPSQPATFYPVVKNGKLANYNEEGRVYTIVVEPALLLSSPDDMGTRSYPINGADGIRNIHR